jgi:hypothetical protein
MLSAKRRSQQKGFIKVTSKIREGKFDRRKDPLGVVFLSHWGAEEEV